MSSGVSDTQMKAIWPVIVNNTDPSRSSHMCVQITLLPPPEPGVAGSIPPGGTNVVVSATFSLQMMGFCRPVAYPIARCRHAR
jgi:hypothetical protein